MNTNPTDAELATGLANAAIKYINKPKFSVYATLDTARPRTIRGFEILGEVLLLAYKQGATDALKENV